MPKRIVITGATRGCGRGLTGQFIRLGHSVAGCGRDREKVLELSSDYGEPHRFDVVDVRDDLQVERWARDLLAEGVPDLLINNAAIINRNAVLWKVPFEEFEAVMDVNVKGVANVLRHFVPAMVDRGEGVIVNFSSGWGRTTDAQVAPYCCSKWAIEGLTRALAQELPKGMCAVPVNPGIIQTDMLRSCFGMAASEYPPPERWAERAAPWLLTIGPRDNGSPMTIPG